MIPTNRVLYADDEPNHLNIGKRFLEESGDDHVIICEDNGDSIVAGENDKIFERGFRKKTGLGLALSQEILSITDITLRETGKPGKDTRFEMTVPIGAYRFKPL